MDWYLDRSGTQFGPYSWDALVGFASSGSVAPGDQVWGPSLTSWQPAYAVPGLFGPNGLSAPPAESQPPNYGQFDPIFRTIVPLGRTPLSIIAGYLGLASILLVRAPFAFVTGIIAAVEIRRDPGKRGMGRSLFGIVAGALGTSLLVMSLAMRYGS